jgi:hypothetical protein
MGRSEGKILGEIMKKILIQWVGWFLFFSAIASFTADLHRYITGDFIALRSVFVCTISSLFIAIWWKILSWGK